MSVKRYLSLALLLAPALALAQDYDDSTVQWNQLVGVITAPAVNNPVGGINAGAGPWSVREGQARVNLTTGQASFEVHGLVLNGTNTSGTPGAIATVVGTLVCNAGTAEQAVRDTPEVRLTQQGDAHFRGEITAIPAACANALFLVRIGPSFPVAGAVGRWIATGAIRTIEAD